MPKGMKGFQQGELHPSRIYGSWNKGKRLSKKTKLKISNNLKGNCNAKGKRWKLSEKQNLEQSQRSKKMWQNPIYREKVRKGISDAIKLKWQDSTYANKILSISSPNKQEIFLNSSLQKSLPNEYKFVGDGQFNLGGKCPDFMNINGKKKLIELFGDYWHGERHTGKTKRQNEYKRINHFKKFGFDTLIIWESALTNSNLKQRLMTFTYK